MSGHHDDEQLKRNIKHALDQRLADLEPDIAARLRRARHDALQAKPVTPWWVPASGLAVAAGITILSFNLWTVKPVPQTPGLLEDLELLTSQESLEFYQELEFYQWLENENETG